VLLGRFDRSQPGLSAFDPKLIRGLEKGGSVGQDAELDFRFQLIDREQSGSAAGTEVPAAKFGDHADMFELSSGPDAIEGEGGPALLPTVGAVADADPNGISANGNLHLAAKAPPPT